MGSKKKKRETRISNVPVALPDLVCAKEKEKNFNALSYFEQPKELYEEHKFLQNHPHVYWACNLIQGKRKHRLKKPGSVLFDHLNVSRDSEPRSLII